MTLFPKPIPPKSETNKLIPPDDNRGETIVEENWWDGQKPMFWMEQHLFPNKGSSRAKCQFVLGTGSLELKIAHCEVETIPHIKNHTRFGWICKDVEIGGRPVRLFDLVPSLMETTNKSDEYIRIKGDQIYIQEAQLILVEANINWIDKDRSPDNTRTIFMWNTGPYIKYLQSTFEGPSHLRFDENGKVLKAWHELDGKWIVVDPCYYDEHGLWLDSTCEYLVREELDKV